MVTMGEDVKIEPKLSINTDGFSYTKIYNPTRFKVTIWYRPWPTLPPEEVATIEPHSTYLVMEGWNLESYMFQWHCF